MAGHILVLDDEERYAQMLQELLLQHRYQSEISTDPREALDRLRQKHFDLVVADYKMPHIDGAEFLLKARKSNPALPVIMVSGLMNMPELLKVANIGVTLVLEKPFDTQDFIEYVSRFVEPMADEPATHGAIAVAGDDPLAETDKPMTWTYPQPARFLADQSREARLLLQAMYDYHAAERHIWLEVADGGELDRVQFEWMAWRGESPDMQRLRFSFQELMSEEARQEFAAWAVRADFSSVIHLRLFAEGIEPPQLADLICFLEDQQLVRERCVFIHEVPSGYPVGEVYAALPDAVAAFCAPTALRVPDLCSRPEDVADYALRIIAQRRPEQPFVWDADAAALLLAYRWPGNYRELQSAIDRCLLLTKDHRITLDNLHTAIRWRHGVIDRDQATLEAFLRRRQFDFILGGGRPAETREELAVATGVALRDIPLVDRWEDLPLLVPQVLASAGSSY
jgi:CheY-like chemotaxis protein